MIKIHKIIQPPVISVTTIVEAYVPEPFPTQKFIKILLSSNYKILKL